MTISLVGSTAVNSNYASPGPVISHSSTGGNTLILTGNVYSGVSGALASQGVTSITDSALTAWTYLSAPFPQGY